MNNFKRQNDESLDFYKLRLIKVKDTYNLTWKDITDLLNEELDCNYSIDKYRKELTKLLHNYYESNSAMPEDYFNTDDEEFVEPLEDTLLELKKERVKLRDERSSNNRLIARLSREESIIEMAKEYAEKMNSFLPLGKPTYKTNTGDKEAILVLSDWHYGIEIDSYWNKYNPDVCKERLAKVMNNTINYCKLNNVSTLHVFNLGDLICGRIHAQLQIESRFDVIRQVMETEELLAELLVEFSKYFKVEYYNCLDNHSRVEPDKKRSLDLESLAMMYPFYLRNRIGVGDNIRIHINDNKFAPDMISTNVLGWTIGGVHGDHDKQNQVVKTLSLMTRENYDLILTAHLHHFSADEQNECVVVSNPSLMGTDSYAKNLRLTSYPAQNLIIVSKNSPVEAIYRIITK